MTSAPIAQQRRLIELQALDSRISRLAHERRSLPVLAQIERTVAELRANRRAAVVAQAALEDARQAATHAEEDVAQVVARAATLRERLHSGAVAARDLSALQGEIDQLGHRQGVLEEAQLTATETLEEAQKAVSELDAAEQEIRARGRGLTSTRDTELARIDEETAHTQEARDALAAELDEALVAAYDAVRARTGGLGAVALHGSRVDGPLELSPQELARVNALDLDTVYHAEADDVIIVRMEPAQA